MSRAFIVCAVILALNGADLLVQSALAQSESSENDRYRSKNGTTMPRPGMSQSDGNTPLDRTIERKDDKTMRGICSNCF